MGGSGLACTLVSSVLRVYSSRVPTSWSRRFYIFHKKNDHPAPPDEGMTRYWSTGPHETRLTLGGRPGELGALASKASTYLSTYVRTTYGASGVESGSGLSIGVLT